MLGHHVVPCAADPRPPGPVAWLGRMGGLQPSRANAAPFVGPSGRPVGLAIRRDSLEGSATKENPSNRADGNSSWDHSLADSFTEWTPISGTPMP